MKRYPKADNRNEYVWFGGYDILALGFRMSLGSSKFSGQPWPDATIELKEQITQLDNQVSYSR